MCPLVRLGWLLGCGLRAAGAQDGVDGKWPRCRDQPLPREDIWALMKRIGNKPNRSLSREEIEKKIERSRHITEAHLRSRDRLVYITNPPVPGSMLSASCALFH